MRLARTTDRAVGDSVGELFAADAGETVLRGVVVLCGVNSSVVEEESPGRAPAAGGVVIGVRVLRLARRADGAVGHSVGELSAARTAKAVLGGVVVLGGVSLAVVEQVAPGRAPSAGRVVGRVGVLRLSCRADGA